MSLRPGESFTIHSVEDFLSDSEIRQLLRPIDQLKTARGPRAFMAGEQDGSVHRLNAFGLTGREAARVFSPEGRIEIPLGPELPDVRDRLDDAFFRRIEDIRRIYPSAVWPRGWTYVEYGPGQHCTAHADGTFSGSQVGACNIRLDDGTVGGEFFVATSGSPELWMERGIQPSQPPELIVASAYDNAWLRAVPKTRWLAQPAKGTALFWGSQLLHGTQPVIQGTAKKIIAWIETQ
jgi:hypothetical protein